MPIKFKLIATALVAVFLFGAGWWVNGWRLSGQHAQELARRDREALVVAEAIKQSGIAANNAISEADTRAWKGLEDDKKELGRLRGCVAAGTCGVRLITKPAADIGASDPGSSGVGDDTLALDPDVQRRVLDHRESIGEDQRKIEFLQAYAVQCWQAHYVPVSPKP
ncbi:MAG: lysis protein [Comamonas sp.]|nr:lysis protein [Comamonas sp.]